MSVRLPPHAQARLIERGATEAELIATVESGTTFPAQLSRTRFRRNFSFNAEWQRKVYAMKKVEAIAAKEDEDWMMSAVIVNFF
ncbi:hypothetical protein QUA42_09400 [Microcoleus sp. Pol11C2]|uniref:hypothetical protein n=1 Tax=Microcoleus sp. Pol11C2 TaxID=3055389 RepID=UPI002FCF961E